MELPKNITQIGEADKSCKIYMEDYVVSYVKQMNRFAEDKEIAIALYGKCSVEQELAYYFIYGACKLDFLQREVKHLSQAQNQEIERFRRKYFQECEFVGYLILNGEMVEGVHIAEPGGCRYVKGYACFYEKNDGMLAYMLDNRMEDTPPEVVDQEKYEEVRKRQEERKVDYEEQQESKSVKTTQQRSSSEIEKHMRGMRFAAASMFVLLCLVSVVTFQSDGVGDEFGSKLKKLLRGMDFTSTQEENTLSVMNNDAVNTLVAEEQLAEAIRQENTQTSQNVGSAGEVVPAQNDNVVNPTQEPASVEAQQVTPQPQVTPNPQPTEVPTQPPVATEIPQVTPQPELEPVSTPVPTQEPTPTLVQSQQVHSTYIIRSGDTLIGISSSLYGSDKYVTDICELNKISNPDNIQIGQKILLP